jgi:hypothetical protein
MPLPDPDEYVWPDQWRKECEDYYRDYNAGGHLEAYIPGTTPASVERSAEIRYQLETQKNQD